MNAKAVSLVLFADTLEENPTPHYGILFDNGFILCLCCGGYVEPEEYEILEDFKGFAYLDDTLKQYF
jgi:hypothetical protein